MIIRKINTSKLFHVKHFVVWIIQIQDNVSRETNKPKILFKNRETFSKIMRET